MCERRSPRRLNKQFEPAGVAFENLVYGLRQRLRDLKQQVFASGLRKLQPPGGSIDKSVQCLVGVMKQPLPQGNRETREDKPKDNGVPSIRLPLFDCRE